MTTTQWHAPGAGQWTRDEVHISTVPTGCLEALMTPAQLEGFEKGFAYFGVTLVGFDVQTIAGRAFLRPRIAGTPPQPIWGDTIPAKRPGPGRPPPKWVLQLLFKLHPELRRRARRAAEVWDKRVWREMTRRWREDLRPLQVGRNRELTRVEVDTLDDMALAAHVEAVAANFRDMFVVHFMHAPMPTVVVGDYLARAIEWSGASASDVLATLQGASPASRDSADATVRIAEAIAADSSARALVESSRPDGEIIAALRATPGDVGRRVNDWLEEHGLRPVSGLDVYHPLLCDLPGLFVCALRAGLAGVEPPRDRSAEAFLALRDRTPEECRSELEDAYAEARLVYAVRDDDLGIVLWCLGLLHRGVREASRRLAKRGAVGDAEHAYEATPNELCAMLRGLEAPDATALARRAARRHELDALEPPVVLGEAGPMPSVDCFPPPVARMQRAVAAYMAAMDGRHGHDVRATADVEGTPVSPGVYEGRARLVHGEHDFAKIQRGDVLIARATSSAYNVVLPLLGAIVTERGGLLSHAAIVAREYGIPAVVDTRNALSRIPEGARVRVDGKSGRVDVLDARATEGPVCDAHAPSAVPDAAETTEDHVPSTLGRVVALGTATAHGFGGKAGALAAAITAKLPVPGGIALDADLVARAVAGEAAARVRITSALAAVPAPWAVRSSAIGEDSAQASFAGQHMTVLGVEPSALFDAVARVYASGHSESARAYRARMGVCGAPRMGIVIQTLLRPEISGVLFSRDPSTTREGRVIEATWGLGEAIVAGLVTPDRYRVGADGAVLERVIGEKDIAIEANEGGGTAEVRVRPERIREACLDDARLAELGQLGSRCEELFGGPQDLEWAIAGGRIHLLQSRPVTTSATR